MSPRKFERQNFLFQFPGSNCDALVHLTRKGLGSLHFIPIMFFFCILNFDIHLGISSIAYFIRSQSHQTKCVTNHFENDKQKENYIIAHVDEQQTTTTITTTTTKKKNGSTNIKAKKVKKNQELVLNEPLALGSNESGYYVAVFACWWFSILLDIVFTLLANRWGAAFAVWINNNENISAGIFGGNGLI